MLEFGKTYPLVRAYFNSKAAWPYCWSIDNGDVHNELIAPNIVGQGVHTYEFSGLEANPLHPVAWVEYREARVHRIDDSEDLLIEKEIE